MKSISGYSEPEDILKNPPSVQNGILVDTNVLISATYELDSFHQDTIVFLDQLIDKKIPLFCNVNVRSEFLEIHRRIIFTEALLSFESVTKGSALGLELRKKLSSLRSNQRSRETQGRAPVQLSDAELKIFKSLMLQEDNGALWNKFSSEYVGENLIDLWSLAVDKIGLTSISLIGKDQSKYVPEYPEWEDAVRLMSQHGISSSDAMIVNIFRSSVFTAILSSDSDIGVSITRLKMPNKICILPDTVLESIRRYQ